MCPTNCYELATVLDEWKFLLLSVCVDMCSSWLLFLLSFCSLTVFGNNRGFRGQSESHPHTFSLHIGVWITGTAQFHSGEKRHKDPHLEHTQVKDCEAEMNNLLLTSAYANDTNTFTYPTKPSSNFLMARKLCNILELTLLVSLCMKGQNRLTS